MYDAKVLKLDGGLSAKGSISAQTVLGANGAVASAERVEWRQAAHDLRGLLCTLNVVAEACSSAAEDRTRRQGARLGRCADRLEAICSSLLETSTLKNTHDDTIVSVLLDAANFAADHAIEGTCVRLDIGTDAPCGELSNALFRILYNLATNAVAAVNNNGGGEVRISAISMEEILIFDVADEGAGFCTELRKSSSQGSGTQRRRPGLGLSIAERYAAEVGAVLFLSETGHGGTTFRLILEKKALSDRHAA